MTGKAKPVVIILEDKRLMYFKLTFLYLVVVSIPYPCTLNYFFFSNVFSSILTQKNPKNIGATISNELTTT